MTVGRVRHALGMIGAADLVDLFVILMILYVAAAFIVGAFIDLDRPLQPRPRRGHWGDVR